MCSICDLESQIEKRENGAEAIFKIRAGNISKLIEAINTQIQEVLQSQTTYI